jgi:hypothetical protein
MLRQLFRFASLASRSACAPILAAGTDARCDAANDIVSWHYKIVTSRDRAAARVVGWRQGPRKAPGNDRAAKGLSIKRIVILGPVPVWKRTLPHSLVNFYRLRHAIAERITTGVSGPQDDQRMEAFSKSAGWNTFRHGTRCATRKGV